MEDIMLLEVIIFTVAGAGCIPTFAPTDRKSLMNVTRIEKRQ
jgi:hypothetical protein